MPLPTARGSRCSALLVALVLMFLLPGAAAAQPAQGETYPGFDLAAAPAALETGKVYRAPAAPAMFDESRVLPLLQPDTRILLAPYVPLEYEADRFWDEVIDPLKTWKLDRDQRWCSWSGSGSRCCTVASSGRARWTASLLAHHGVTADLVLALENLRSGLGHLDDPPPRPVPPDPAERDAVLAGPPRPPPISPRTCGSTA